MQRAKLYRPGNLSAADSTANSPAATAALGPAIDDYITHGSASLQNIRSVLVSQRGDLLAERYYQSDAAEHVDIQSATKSVISTLVGIALTNGISKAWIRLSANCSPSTGRPCRKAPPTPPFSSC